MLMFSSSHIHFDYSNTINDHWELGNFYECDSQIFDSNFTATRNV